jgi:nucleotide-binding universal stress UspA family protein
MTILCGTDFSDHAAEAARVAAGIAARLGLPLRLVHVVPPERVGGEDTQQGPAGVEASARIVDEALRLRLAFGIEIEGRTESGHADEILVSLAERTGARWIVLGSLGTRDQHQWLLGSVAERVAQASAVPVLVVRNGARIEAWTNGGASLRVLAGVEPTPGSLAALRWASGLRAIGPTKLVVARIAWPVHEHGRLGIPPPVPLDRLRPELEAALLDETRTWADIEPGADVAFVVRAGFGRVDVHLTQVAEELGTDLLVVGSHRRATVARLWQGSVSRGVLHGAPMSVACVPAESNVPAQRS